MFKISGKYRRFKSTVILAAAFILIVIKLLLSYHAASLPVYGVSQALETIGKSFYTSPEYTFEEVLKCLDTFKGSAIPADVREEYDFGH